ncbi:MAG: hypothetical protein DMF56_18055 [Acidobacteria bacterium]|nr:MAG: hypothetical protein DMF56_18055 [Acidobacteriota bacterium]
MHQKITSGIVARPIGEAFDWLTTPGFWPRVSPVSLAIEAEDPWRPLRVGDRFRERAHVALWRGHFDWVVDAVERPHRCVLTAVTGGDTVLSKLTGHIPARLEITLESDGDSTRITRAASHPALAEVVGFGHAFDHACDVTMQTIVATLNNPLLFGPRPDSTAESLLHEADPLADDAAAALISAAGDCSALESLVASLDRGDPPDADVPEAVRRFLDATEQRPAWACESRLVAASEIFLEWGVLSVAAHICASLPETYQLPPTAKLLDLTRQLDADPHHVDRRLWFTVRMCFDVLTEHGLDANGRGRLALQRLRLLHAMVRLFVQRRLETPHRLSQLATRGLWDSDAGQPISQLELLHTLLTFSHGVVRSFAIFGVELTPYQRESYIHIWNVAGALLGIRPELLPRDADDAARIFEGIKQRFGGATDAAPRLGRGLVEFWTGLFPEMIRKEASELMQFVISMLLTPETAHINGFDDLPSFSPKSANALRHFLAGVDRIGSHLFSDVPPVQQAAALFVSLLMRKASEAYEDKSGIFDIPEKLYSRWCGVVAT